MEESHREQRPMHESYSGDQADSSNDEADLSSQAKPPEVLQAQVAAFAAEGIEKHEDAKHVFDRIGDLSSGPVTDVVKTTTQDEWERNAEGRYDLVPAGTEVIVATVDQYKDFLRAAGGSRYESIQGRVDILVAYKEFAPAVAELKQRVEAPSLDGENHRIGEGASSTVYPLTIGNKQYAVRTSREGSDNAQDIDEHLAGAVLREKLPPSVQQHFEHVVAASYEDGVTIAEMVPGKVVNELSIEELSQIPDDHLNELIDILRIANEYGIMIDSKPTNIFYDRERGFIIIDITSSKIINRLAEKQTASGIIGEIGPMFTSVGLFHEGSEPNMQAKDPAQELEMMRANLAMIERYRKLVEHKIPEDEGAEALGIIDETIQNAREAVDGYWETQDRMKERAERTASRLQDKERRARGEILEEDEDPGFV